VRLPCPTLPRYPTMIRLHRSRAVVADPHHSPPRAPCWPPLLPPILPSLGFNSSRMSTFLPVPPCRAPDGRSSHHIPTLFERGGSGHTPSCSPSASPLLRPHELADFPLFPISGEQCPHRLRPNSDIYGESPTLYFLSQKPLKMSYCSDLFPFISDGRVSAYPRHRPPLTPGCRI
jgi:hypothetical protein